MTKPHIGCGSLAPPPRAAQRRAVLRPALVASALLLVAFAPLRAQCPDGSPPPCGRALATPRVADPPIDDRRWIVLPFTNVARTAELDWLSDASVDLLSLDLSRWTDVRVVDANRVAELIRRFPEAERRRIGLDSGIAVAKRAGAARLVLGQYLRQGDRTTIAARVLDVRTGERIRVAEDTVVTMDSVGVAYGRLAPKVLNLRPPPGTTLTGLGTASTQAVRVYALGMQALNRGRTDSAALFMLQAVELDSAFALAHHRLASVIARTPYAARYPGGAERARATAARLASTLPERERLVIGVGLTACERGSRLLALDSADAEGWVATGDCYRGQNRVVVGADGLVRREGSFEAARRAYERALAFGPVSAAAIGIQHLAWMSAGACPTTKPGCAQAERYQAAIVFNGDTMSTAFEPWRGRFDPPWRRKEFEAPRGAKLAAFTNVLRRWTAMHPENLLGHAIRGSVLARDGVGHAGRRPEPTTLQLLPSYRRAAVRASGAGDLPG